MTTYLTDREWLEQYNGHLVDAMPDTVDNLIGREKDLKEIEKILDRQGFCVLRGENGIGKTTLASAYAKAARDQYDHIQYVNFTETFLHTIVDGVKLTEDIDWRKEVEAAAGAEQAINPICYTVMAKDGIGIGRKVFEGIGRRKLAALTERCGNSLLIIDNFHSSGSIMYGMRKNLPLGDWSRKILTQLKDAPIHVILIDVGEAPLSVCLDDACVHRVDKLEQADLDALYLDAVADGDEGIPNLHSLADLIDRNTGLMMRTIDCARAKGGNTYLEKLRAFLKEYNRERELRSFGAEHRLGARNNQYTSALIRTAATSPGARCFAGAVATAPDCWMTKEQMRHLMYDEPEEGLKEMVACGFIEQQGEHYRMSISTVLSARQEFSPMGLALEGIFKEPGRYPREIELAAARYLVDYNYDGWDIFAVDLVDSGAYMANVAEVLRYPLYTHWEYVGLNMWELMSRKNIRKHKEERRILAKRLAAVAQDINKPDMCMQTATLLYEESPKRGDITARIVYEYCLGRGYYLKRQFEEAASHYQAARKQVEKAEFEKTADYWLCLGTLYQYENKVNSAALKKAEECLDKGLELLQDTPDHPLIPAIRKRRIRVYNIMGCYEKTVEELEKIRDFWLAHPEMPEALIKAAETEKERSDTFYALGKEQASIDAGEHAIAMMEGLCLPKDERPGMLWKNLSELLLMMSENIDTDADDPDTLSERAIAANKKAFDMLSKAGGDLEGRTRLKADLSQLYFTDMEEVEGLKCLREAVALADNLDPDKHRMLMVDLNLALGKVLTYQNKKEGLYYKKRAEELQSPKKQPKARRSGVAKEFGKIDEDGWREMVDQLRAEEGLAPLTDEEMEETIQKMKGNFKIQSSVVHGGGRSKSRKKKKPRKKVQKKVQKRKKKKK